MAGRPEVLSDRFSLFPFLTPTFVAPVGSSSRLSPPNPVSFPSSVAGSGGGGDPSASHTGGPPGD